MSELPKNRQPPFPQTNIPDLDPEQTHHHNRENFVKSAAAHVFPANPAPRDREEGDLKGAASSGWNENDSERVQRDESLIKGTPLDELADPIDSNGEDRGSGKALGRSHTGASDETVQLSASSQMDASQQGSREVDTNQSGRRPGLTAISGMGSVSNSIQASQLVA